MLETLITSKTRIKLLTKFFLNPQSKAYLRELEESFDESSNAVRLELNRFEKAGLLNSSKEKNRKVYSANIKHPLFQDIHNILRKHIGIDHIIEQITGKLGQIEQVWLCGELAKGNDSNTIDLIIVGTVNDDDYLEQLRKKAANIIGKSIMLTIYTQNAFTEVKSKINTEDIFLLWDAKIPA